MSFYPIWREENHGQWNQDIANVREDYLLSILQSMTVTKCRKPKNAWLISPENGQNDSFLKFGLRPTLWKFFPFFLNSSGLSGALRPYMLRGTEDTRFNYKMTNSLLLPLQAGGLTFWLQGQANWDLERSSGELLVLNVECTPGKAIFIYTIPEIEPERFWNRYGQILDVEFCLHLCWRGSCSWFFNVKCIPQPWRDGESLAQYENMEK